MKKVFAHVAVILTAAFVIFILGLFIGRQQIPNETIPSGVSAENTTVPEETTPRLNINTATAEELCTLPGIGKVTANAIIDYRTENGAFTSIEQLLNISGIGVKKFEEIIDLICLE